MSHPWRVSVGRVRRLERPVGDRAQVVDQERPHPRTRWQRPDPSGFDQGSDGERDHFRQVVRDSAVGPVVTVEC